MSRYKLPLVKERPTVGHDAVSEDVMAYEAQAELSVQPLPIDKHLEPELQRLKQRIADYEAENQHLKQAMQDKMSELRQELMQECRPLVEHNLYKEIDQLSSLHETINYELNQSMLGLVENIADIVIEANVKILGQQLLDRRNAIEVVKTVLKKAGYQETMQVKVSPDDLELINRHKLKLSPAKNIEYTSDDKVKIGGCMVDTNSGILDGRIEVQLQALYELLSDKKQNAGD